MISLTMKSMGSISILIYISYNLIDILFDVDFSIFLKIFLKLMIGIVGFLISESAISKWNYYNIIGFVTLLL